MDFDLQSIENNFKVKFSHFQRQFEQMHILNLAVLKAFIPEEEMEAIEGFFKCVEPALVKDHSSIEYFVGYASGKPVATCSVFYSHFIASIFDVIVSPFARGQGLGKLITAAGMKKAAENGFETFALTATNHAKFLYEKIGFQNLKLLRVYSE